MFIRRANKKAQSTLEYAILISVLVAALIAMQTYLKRGVQGKIRESSDQIGESFSPGYTTSNRVTHSGSNITESQNQWDQTTTINNQWTNVVGAENVLAAECEYWGVNASGQ